MVAGTGRFCTEVMAQTGERAFVKTGAEGVFCAALPEQGIGIALKAADGAGRASEAAMAHLLERFGALNEASRQALADRLHPSIFNRAGRLVGSIRVNAA
jgi:L-asparaginase II